MSRYLKSGEAARELGISQVQLWRWKAAGIVTPAKKTSGGHFLWDLTSLKAQVERHKIGHIIVTPEDIARIIHNANRDLQIVQGDPVPSPPWDDDEVPEYQREQNVASVEEALGNPDLTPRQNHEGWYERMRADGFVYGPVKDPVAKTHPTLLPWDQLPAEQRLKNRLFVAIVRALEPGTRREETT
jgi:DNA-binding transcriptional MerR regulator